MSAIYFHTKYGEERVAGRERAYAGNFCSGVFAEVLRVNTQFPDKRDVERWLAILPPDNYLKELAFDHKKFFYSLKTWLAVDNGSLNVTINGKREAVEIFAASLNTAIRMGSLPIKFLARMHGQCEIHAYIEAEDKPAFADIIEEGRDSNIYRKDMGWESVVTLLRKKDDSPVVMSYSVCEQFPNPYISGEQNEEETEKWYQLPFEKQWECAMGPLRHSGGGLRLKPDLTQLFGDGYSGFDIREALDEIRVREMD